MSSASSARQRWSCLAVLLPPRTAPRPGHRRSARGRAGAMAPKKAKSKNDKAHKAAVSATTAAAAVTASTQQKPSPVGKSEQVAGRSLGERVTSANRQAAEVVNADTEEEEVEPFGALTMTSPGPFPPRSTEAAAEAPPPAPAPKTTFAMVSEMLENDEGRALLVRNRFTEADGDNSGTLDTDEAIALIGTL